MHKLKIERQSSEKKGADSARKGPWVVHKENRLSKPQLLEGGGGVRGRNPGFQLRRTEWGRERKRASTKTKGKRSGKGSSHRPSEPSFFCETKKNATAAKA